MLLCWLQLSSDSDESPLCRPVVKAAANHKTCVISDDDEDDDDDEDEDDFVGLCSVNCLQLCVE